MATRSSQFRWFVRELVMETTRILKVWFPWWPIIGGFLIALTALLYSARGVCRHYLGKDLEAAAERPSIPPWLSVATGCVCMFSVATRNLDFESKDRSWSNVLARVSMLSMFILCLIVWNLLGAKDFWTAIRQDVTILLERIPFVPEVDSSGTRRCRVCANLCPDRSLASRARRLQPTRDIALRDLTDLVCEGCQICATLRAVILRIDAESPIPGSEDAFLRIQLRSNVVQLFAEGGDKVTLEFSLYSPDPHHSRIVLLPEASLFDTQSELSFQRVQGWIETCVTRHSLCPSTISSTLPDRILEVGDGICSNVYLREPRNEVARYACLSHSWGKSELLRTTKHNVAQHLTEIRWETLSKLLQDTIMVCRRLSIRYLWVDTICIIQDSPTDWATQAAKMATIYQNAYLTIASTWTTSHDDGLHATSIPPYSYLKVSAEDIGHGGYGDVHVVLGSKRAKMSVPHWTSAGRNILSEVQRDFPLLQRAWVFQERLLSPRILHFGAHELLWECRDRMLCDCGQSHRYTTIEDLDTLLQRMVGDQSIPGLESRTSAQNPQQYIFGDSPNQPFPLWYTIVERYSELMGNLTYEADVFPALSGIADRISVLANDQYIAGLWKTDLISGLLWVTKNPRREEVRCWRAPSWSWASVNGPVKCHGKNNNSDQGLFLPHADVVYVECSPAKGESTGEISSARLKLRAEIVPATLELRVPDLVEQLRLHWHHDDTPPRLFPDCLEALVTGEAYRN